MKKLLVFFLTLFLFSSVYAERVIEGYFFQLLSYCDDKRYYLCVKGESTPFTGTLIDTKVSVEHREKSYKNGLQHGISKDYYGNGNKSKETNFKYNKKRGKQTFWHKNGNIKQIINWKDGQKHGKETTWWRKNNTKKQVINWRDGQKVGLETKWSRKGKEKYQKSHKATEQKQKLNTDSYGVMYALNPKRLYTGQDTTLHPSGKKLAITNYKDGLKDGIFTRYSETGSVKEKTNYKKGKKHGAYESWYDNGNKMRVATYMDGKLHGLLTNWHSHDPIKSIETNYENGKKHGLETSWYENGAKKSHRNYTMGTIDKKTIKIWNREGGKDRQDPEPTLGGLIKADASTFGYEGYIAIINTSVDLLKKQATNGDAQAQYQLGLNHLGVGKPSHNQDLEKAIYWLEKAAKQQHPGAEYDLLLIRWLKASFL
jgi:antitoxin component YwqK of YwqJK toxin-antitoxin module